ncbi:MAG: tetratricopeptide repeat protein [Ferruginibacter sp.]
MSLKKILASAFLFICLAASAQDLKNQPVSRILKTATSLMEAQQYEAAEQYFKTGLQQAQARKDAYYMAQAYEGLGNLYNKTEQKKAAAEAYEKSLKLYKAQGLTVIANVVESLLKNVQGIGDLYAGIEIGARGNKLSIMEVKMGRSGENEYTLKMDTSINTDAAMLSYQSEKETHDAVAIFYGIAKKRFGVPANRTHIVISSGLKQELDKYNKVEYFASIVRPKDLDPKIKITYITAVQEAELSFRGIVPQKSRLNADQLDIGSGNTKGGYFDRNKNFVPITLPYGTRSFQRMVETNGSINNLEEYRQAAQKIMNDTLARLMVYEFANKNDFKSRDVVYISGGIVWAVASMMHPQLVNENYVELTQQDISEFRTMIYSDYDKLTKPDLSYISDKEVETASLKTIGRVLKTYDQKALVSGAIWLDELVQQVNTLNPGKKLIFVRNSYVGWISGYIMEKVNRQFTGLAIN